MTGFQGMDTAQVSDFGELLQDRAGTLDEQFDSLRSLVDSIVGSQWVGPDAEDFRTRFTEQVLPRATERSDRLRDLRNELDTHREEQDQASDVDDGFSLDDFFGGVGDFFEGAGNFLGEVWDNFTDNLLPPSWDDIVGGGLTAGGSIWKELAKAAGKSVPKAIPLVGDVFTGVMAGIERWNQDDGRPFWERLGRAGADGLANAAGSFLGGLAGGAIGGGAMLLLGAGIGAVTGSVPGALAGGGVGVIAGGIVGEVVGGYVGAAAGDAIIDAILD